jgi:hypothetical protein
MFTIVGFEVLGAVFMNITIFWNITSSSPLQVNRRLVGTYRLHLQGLRISRERYQRESRWQRPVFGKRSQASCHREHTNLIVLHAIICGLDTRKQGYYCLSSTNINLQCRESCTLNLLLRLMQNTELLTLTFLWYLSFVPLLVTSLCRVIFRQFVLLRYLFLPSGISLRKVKTCSWNFLAFQVITAVTVKITFIWDVIPCRLENRPTFRRKMSPPSSESKKEPNKKPSEVGDNLIWFLACFILRPWWRRKVSSKLWAVSEIHESYKPEDRVQW